MNTLPFPITDAASRKNLDAILAREPLLAGNLPGMITINANRPWTGKTTLARHIIKELFGVDSASYDRWPPSESRMVKTLSLACDRALPYLFFDNVAGHIDSHPLAAFLTSETWNYRLLGRSDYETRPIVTRIIITGNNLTLSEELHRRNRWIDLSNDSAEN